MIQTRLPHSRPTVNLTRGDEEPRAACRDDIAPFEAMFEHRPETRFYAAARREAAKVCARCPLERCADRVVAA